MGRVDGKVAIVTGAAMGIGRATAVLLAREGARVAVTDIESDAGQTTVEEITRSGGDARFWHLDTSDEQSVSEAFDHVIGAFGRLDVLVNNAGIAGITKPTHEITLEEWNHVMSINLNGVFLSTKHAIPAMRRAGGGSIVNLSSIYGMVGSTGAPAYHAAKGAVRLMTKTDALTYAADGIRVNSVHPGFIWTPMVENSLRRRGDVEAGRREIDERQVMGRMGEPNDIAYGILYLASDEAKFVTGSELVIDGGYTAR